MFQVNLGVSPDSKMGAESTPHLFGLLIFLLGTTLACGGKAESPNPKVPPGAKSSGGKHAVIETDKGNIEIELFEKEAPKAVENFRLLAEHGPRARGLAWRRGAQRHVELPASDEFAIGDAFGAIGSRADDAIHYGKLLNRYGETRRGEPEQRFTGCRSSLCQIARIEIARCGLAP